VEVKLDWMRQQAIDTNVSTSGPQFSGRCRRYSEKSLPAEGTFTGRALVLASGAMGAASISGEAEFLGRGVSYCATCDAAYRNREVVVVGISNEAIEEAQVLASTVHWVTPKNT